MQPERGILDGQHLVLRNAEGGAQAVVVRIFVRNEGVEAVVAAGELDQDEDGAVFLRRGRGGERGLDEK